MILMKRGHSLAAFLIAGLLLAATPSAVHAQTPPSAAEKETARGLFDNGVQAEKRGDLGAAEAFFRDANNLVHVPSTALFLARVQARQGRLVEARDHALEATRAPVLKGEDPFQARCRAEAATLAAELEGRIPSLLIRLRGDRSQATLAIDGTPTQVLQTDAPRKLNPGAHTITASAPGLPPTTVNVLLGERESKEVTIDLAVGGAYGGAALMPPPRRKPNTIGPILLMAGGFGLGGASFIAGAVTGGLSLAQTEDLKDQCNGACPPTLQTEFDEANTLATVSDVTLLVGGGLVAAGTAGLVWYLVATNKSAARVGLSMGVAPSGLRLLGEF